jgi:hypothetical protein
VASDACVCDGGRCEFGVRTDADSGDGRGALGDGGLTLPDGGRRPPGAQSGGVGTPFTSDGGFDFPDSLVATGCTLGLTMCSGACVDLRSSAGHCGACDTACGSDQFCIAGTCNDACDAPLVLCGGQCVDLQVDETACGACGTVCASGLCVTGECTDVIPGHVVVIGHDYASSASPTMQRIAGNALFLARGSPVRTLVYRGTVEAKSIAGVTSAIDAIVAADGRAWQQIDAVPDQVGAQLRDVDAFLIHAQAGATDAALKALGQTWGLALSQFVLRGGVILLFETSTDKNGGGYRILTPSGLFEAEAREPIARQNLTVVTFGIGVAARATRVYRAAATTVHFLNVLSPATVVVQDKAAEAVVLHRVVAL